MEFLKKNDIVDVIFPATTVTAEEVAKIRSFLIENDLQPRIYLEEELILKQEASHEFPSFSAEKRFEQLKNALENNESKAIWCARGGYGSGELLPFLCKLKKPKNQKIFIGFSDIVSLQSVLIDKFKYPVIAAPGLTQIIHDLVDENSKKAVIDFIFGKKTELKYELAGSSEPWIDNKTKINSTLTGGCVSVLSGHFGTKNQINWKNKILFLEDEGETGERLDRYFRQICEIIIEKKSKPKAILLGNFLLPNNHGIPKQENVETAIQRFSKRLEKLQIPLFREKTGCLGHGKNMSPLVLGKEAELKNGFLVQYLKN